MSNLPCPFCGGRVDPEHLWIDSKHRPTCVNCDSTSSDIMTWNQRLIPDSSDSPEAEAEDRIPLPNGNYTVWQPAYKATISSGSIDKPNYTLTVQFGGVDWNWNIVAFQTLPQKMWWVDNGTEDFLTEAEAKKRGVEALLALAAASK